jgi:hypothetical protein
MDPEVESRRFATPTGGPCPRCLRVDGTVQGSGDCVGCGTCLQFGGLVEELDDGCDGEVEVESWPSPRHRLTGDTAGLTGSG